MSEIVESLSDLEHMEDMTHEIEVLKEKVTSLTAEKKSLEESLWSKKGKIKRYI